MTTQTLLDFDLSESSDDSDFRIEDHDDVESDDLDSINSNDDQSDKDDSDVDSDDERSDNSDNEFSKFQNELSRKKADENDDKLSTTKLLEKSVDKEAFERSQAKILAKPICCACLGDRSDDTNEIVECDNCGISVHEGCYGISDSTSVSSTVSSCSTEPWFCEACKANISDPVCELCPNKGGIYKETDVGKWVHLVCALYVPGVAFGEVDHLSSVTLFEMPYSKWGAKTCSLCEDARFARCGVCIGCDAGMCKTFFHVTCAQAAGLLSEAHSEEADHADPFYAHCKIHSDKTLIRHRKRNYNALRMKMSYRIANIEQFKLQNTSLEQKRIERKLKKHRNKYISNKTIKNEPWVPTQKIPRLLTTSASACRRLLTKAELMGIDVAALEFQEAQVASLNDVRKKWHIPPAFSVEFIGYYLDRISRSKDVKTNLQEQLELNKKLVSEQQSLREGYDEAIAIRSEQIASKEDLIAKIDSLHSAIRALCPNKSLVSIDNIIHPPLRSSTPKAATVASPPSVRPMSVPTAAALKMGVGFPLTNLPGISDDTNRILSTQCQNKTELLYDCGICKRINDQHLLAKCDTCHLHYHLGCLNPPLTRHPKKSKIYGWQCSECDEDNPEGVVQLTSGPRKSRTKYSKDGTIVPVDSSRDVSLDESADDEKMILQSITKSPIANVKKSPTPSPVKKSNKKCDKVPELDARVIIKPLKVENKTTKVSNNIKKSMESTPSLPTSPTPDSNVEKKLNTSKSPTKSISIKSPSKKSNIDKVIEAVSKGILDKVDKKRNGKTKNTAKDVKEVKEVDSSIEMNGFSETLNDSKSAINSEKSSPKMPRLKIKTGKRSRKEKEKEKDKDKVNDKEKDEGNDNDKDTNNAKKKPDNKSKDKPKEKVKGKGKETEREKDKEKDKEKVKRKRKAKVEEAGSGKTTQAKERKIDGNSSSLELKPEVTDGKMLVNKIDENIVGTTTTIGETNVVEEKPAIEMKPNVPDSSASGQSDAINITNGDTKIGPQNMELSHKQSRKRRKEKHRNKHGPDSERSSSKEHKKKRKRKCHDIEKPESFTMTTDGVPKIKIKFKALPLPGETATEAHCFYVPANMVRPRDYRKNRPDSVNSIDDIASQPFSPKSPPSTVSSPPPNQNESLAKPISTPPLRTRRLSVLLSPSKAQSKSRTSTPVTATSSNSNDTNDMQACDVCQVLCTAQDLVKCDECKKSYHFRCLDPPLKKTPKRRGYSWHCADCDPTDREDN